MNQNDFTLYNHNMSLNHFTNTSDLNFCKMLYADPSQKLSVIAEFTPSSDGYITLSKSLDIAAISCTNHSNVVEDFYYGASPLIDSALIRKAVSMLAFSTCEKLDQFISEHHDKFMLHPCQEKFLLPLARYILISFAMNFGIRIRVYDELAEQLINECDPGHAFMKRKNEIITICGCPTEKVLGMMSEYRFKEDLFYDSNSDEEYPVWTVTKDGGIDFRSIYASMRNVYLLNGEVFYSGVLLRAVNIELLPDHYENKNITSIRFGFEKSTYATVFALDNNFTDHPVLSSCKYDIVSFFVHDDQCKELLKRRLEEIQQTDKADCGAMINCVSEYLKTSNGVNQIGVSANIITKDNYLLFGMRGTNSIDGGHLYPSANGNAEIKDRNVPFYRHSVYEDFPTISVDAERIDFLDEIKRETYAELGSDVIKPDALCYGLTISGIIPDIVSPQTDEYIYSSRRMHFNVIYEQACSISLMDIVKSKKSATESFENKEIVGVKICCHKNFFSFLGRIFLNAVQAVVESKDIIESLSLIILLLCLRDSVFDWQTGVSLVLAVLIIFFSIVHMYEAICSYVGKQKHILKHVVFSWKKHKIRKSTINIFNKQSFNSASKQVSKSFYSMTYHPVTAASYIYYVSYQAYHSFFDRT